MTSFSAKVEREEMKERMLNRVVVYPENFSDNAKSLCDGLLAKEVDKRMGFKNECCDEIRAHPFFSDINWRKLNAGPPYFHWFSKTFCLIYFMFSFLLCLLVYVCRFDPYFSSPPPQVSCLLLSSPTLKWCTPKAWTT